MRGEKGETAMMVALANHRQRTWATNKPHIYTRGWRDTESETPTCCHHHYCRQWLGVDSGDHQGPSSSSTIGGATNRVESALSKLIRICVWAARKGGELSGSRASKITPKPHKSGPKLGSEVEVGSHKPRWSLPCCSRNRIICFVCELVSLVMHCDVFSVLEYM